MRLQYLIPLFALLTAPPAHAQRDPLTASFDWFQYRGSDPVPGRNTPTSYHNPILQGFYPDPSVTRVGDDYYLVTSTFGYYPGIPVFHSKDLVNWTQIGNAIDRPDQLDFKKLGLSRGVFAPTIQAKDGNFYILNTCVDCGGNFLLTAKDPAGPWSNPIWLPSLEGGIDPSLFFDDDGRTWVVSNGGPPGPRLYDGHSAIWVQEIDLNSLATIGPRTAIANGGVDISTHPRWIEGPHILKKDGYYYLVAAEGGTEQGHSEVVFRSKNVLGPYTPGANNPILTQRDLPENRRNPITSSGHAQLVETQNGDWWATFLSVRPYSGNFFNTGRETFLMPVTWTAGWPRITRPGEALPYNHARPRLPHQPAPKLATNGPLNIRDEFNGDVLPPYWMMLRNPHSLWYVVEDGKLTLTARHAGLGDNANPSFLARRQQNIDASAETLVRFAPRHDGDRAGLAVLANDDFWASVAVGQEGGERIVTLEWRHGADQPATGLPVASKPLKIAPGAPVYLQITARGSAYDFAYATTPGHWIPLGKVDGTTLSTQIAGGFIGAVFGPYARSGE
jgi:alpha-N-arabinofuranosidase